MPVHVKAPDGLIYQLPDGLSPEEMKRKIEAAAPGNYPDFAPKPEGGIDVGGVLAAAPGAVWQGGKELARGLSENVSNIPAALEIAKQNATPEGRKRSEAQGWLSVTNMQLEATQQSKTRLQAEIEQYRAAAAAGDKNAIKIISDDMAQLDEIAASELEVTKANADQKDILQNVRLADLTGSEGFRQSAAMRKTVTDFLGAPAEGIGYDAMRAIGGVAGQVGTAALITAATKNPMLAASVLATQGYLQSSESVYQEAISMGASPEVAQASANAAGAFGLIEFAPIFDAIKLIPPSIRGKVTNALMKKIMGIAEAGGKEGLQEAATQIGTNLTAFHDPDRKWDDQALESLFIGAIAGGTVHATIGHVGEAPAPDVGGTRNLDTIETAIAAERRREAQQQRRASADAELGKPAPIETMPTAATAAAPTPTRLEDTPSIIDPMLREKKRISARQIGRVVNENDVTAYTPEDISTALVNRPEAERVDTENKISVWKAENGRDPSEPISFVDMQRAGVEKAHLQDLMIGRLAGDPVSLEPLRQSQTKIFDDAQYASAVTAVTKRGRYTMKAIEEAAGNRKTAEAIRNEMVSRGDLMKRGDTFILPEQKAPNIANIPHLGPSTFTAGPIAASTIQVKSNGRVIGTFPDRRSAEVEANRVRAEAANRKQTPTVEIVADGKDNEGRGTDQRVAHAVYKNEYDTTGNFTGRTVVSTHATPQAAMKIATDMNAQEQTNTAPPATPTLERDVPLTPTATPGAQKRTDISPVLPYLEEISANLEDLSRRRGTPLLGTKVQLVPEIVDTEGNKVDAVYSNKVIRIALDTITPDMTLSTITEKVGQLMDHELVHALRETGVLPIGGQAWNTLVNYVGKAVRPDTGLTYVADASRLYKEDVKAMIWAGVPEEQIADYIYEEAIAEAFRQWAADRRAVGGKPATIFRQLVQFFKNLFDSVPNNVFAAIESGSMVRAAAKAGRIQTAREADVQAYEDAKRAMDLAENPVERDAAQQEMLRSVDQAVENRKGRIGPRTVLGMDPSEEFVLSALVAPNQSEALLNRYSEIHGYYMKPPSHAMLASPNFMTQVAAHHQSAKHNPSSVETQKAYGALKSQLTAMFTALDVTIEPWRGSGQPYTSQAEMIDDMARNHRVRMRLTDDLFGKDPTQADHPMQASAGIKAEDNTPLTYNDLLRVVGEVYGYSPAALYSSPENDYRAYRQLSSYFDTMGQRALATEMLAPSAWQNFGPHMLLADGTVAPPESLGYVPEERREFAPQKAYAMPVELLEGDAVVVDTLADVTEASLNERYARRPNPMDNPNFQRWFKRSVVVDAWGKPRIVYHATVVGFDEFNTVKAEFGSHFGSFIQAETLRGGNVAFTYYPVYLSIQNPLRLRDMGNFDNETVASQLRELGIIDQEIYNKIYGNVTAHRRLMQSILKNKGYDGIVYLNRYEGFSPEQEAAKKQHETSAFRNMSDELFRINYSDAQDSYIVFEGSQVKSAIANNGNYSEMEYNIRYSRKRPSLDEMGYREDNPTTKGFSPDWMADKQRYADETYARTKGITGSVSGYFRQPIMLSTEAVRSVPGLMDENRRVGDPQYDALMQSVTESGWTHSAKNAILIGVNHRGEAYVIEGNTRAAVAEANGQPYLYGEVRWFNGAETVPGSWSPEAVRDYVWTPDASSARRNTSDDLVLRVERGKNAIASVAPFTPEEFAAVKAAATATNLKQEDIVAQITKVKLANPEQGGWMPVVFKRLKMGENGKPEYIYQEIPYAFDKDPATGQVYSQTTGDTQAYDTRVDALAKAMRDEVRKVYDRAQNGDKNAQNIIKQASWYKAMRSRLRQEFGGLGDLFADLLGATSPNTPVRGNWDNAIGSLRRAMRGDFDKLIGEWVSWANNVDQMETDLSAWIGRVQTQFTILERNRNLRVQEAKNAQKVQRKAYEQAELARGRNESLLEIRKDDAWKEIGAQQLDELKIEKSRYTKAAMKTMPEYMRRMDNLRLARELPESLNPVKETGAKYGFNGRNVARAMVDLWRVVHSEDADIGRGTTAPKALNFSGNLIGFRERATIDVWAARLLQRLAGYRRIASVAEATVGGSMIEGGETKGQFRFGQDVFSKAVERIRNDPSMSTDPVLSTINDDDLQAVVWFIEKEIWTANDWTSAAGEGGSFEFEANLTGASAQDLIRELRRVQDSSKSTPEQREQATEQLKHLERTVDRFSGGLTSQMSVGRQGMHFIPLDADLARLGEDIRSAIYADDNIGDVLASKASSTLGVYGEPERSIDFELVARQGYDPKNVWLEILRTGQRYRQDAVYITRALREEEMKTYDPLVHRPGIELYFRSADAYDKLNGVLSKLAEKDFSFFTVIVDGRRSPDALSGAMPNVVGLRAQSIPEFGEREGFDLWAGLTDEEIIAKNETEAERLENLAASIAAEVPDVGFAGQFWYETEVAFANQYQEKIDGVTNRSATAPDTGNGSQVWRGQSIREGVEAAARWAAEAESRKPDVYPVDRLQKGPIDQVDGAYDTTTTFTTEAMDAILPSGRLFGKAKRSLGGMLSEPGTPSPDYTNPIRASAYFGGQYAERQLQMSRDGERGATLVHMQVEDFLKLAKEPVHPDQAVLGQAMREGFKFNTMPSLVYDGTGTAVIVGSDGRAIAEALKDRVETIPVMMYPKDGVTMEAVTLTRGDAVVSVNGVQEFDATRRGERQFVNTTEFKDWFRDSVASLADGSPIPVFARPMSETSVFNTREFNFHSNYSTTPMNGKVQGLSPYPSYISIQNPLVIDAGGAEPFTIESVAQALADRGVIDQGTLFDIRSGMLNGQTEVTAAMVMADMDGVQYRDQLGNQSFIALRPEQVKAAVNTEGRWASAETDTRFARRRGRVLPPGQAGFDTYKNTATHRFGRWLRDLGRSDNKIFGVVSPFEIRKGLFDEGAALADISESMIEAGINVTPEANAHMMLTSAGSKAKYEIDEVRATLQDPMLDEIKANIKKKVLTYADVHFYLYARHAQEVNDRLRAVGSPEPNPSGWDDAKIAQVKAAYNNGDPVRLAALQSIAAKADAIVRNINAVRVATGQIEASVETAPIVIGKAPNQRKLPPYQYWVPLRDSDDVDPYDVFQPSAAGRIKSKAKRKTGTSRGLTNTGRPDPRAFGRSSEAGDIISNLMLIQETTIIRGQRSGVMAETFLQQLNLPGAQAFLRNKVRVTTKFPTKLVYTSDGTIRRIVDDNYRNKDGIVVLKVQGREVVLEVDDPEIEAVLKTPLIEQFSMLMRFAMASSRTFGQLSTVRDPGFLLTNLPRDVQDAVINMTRGGKAGLAVKMLTRIPKAAVISAAALGGKLKKTQMGQDYEEMKRNGWTVSMMGAPDLERTIRRIRYRAGALSGRHKVKAMAVNMGNAFFDGWDALNEVVENSTRLAFYSIVRDATASPRDPQTGVVLNPLQDKRSIAYAGYGAKNSTINFERGGTLRKKIGAFYLFANPTLQSVSQLAKSLMSWRGLATMGGVMAFGFATGFMTRMLAGDDEPKDGVNDFDEVSNDILARNIIMYNPMRFYDPKASKFLMMPMTVGPYGAVFSMGREAARMWDALTNVRQPVSPAQSAAKMIISSVGAMNFLGDTERPFNMVTPYFLDPAIDLGSNRNWANSPIWPEVFDDTTPMSQRYFDNADPWMVGAANWLNETAGGDKYTKSFADVSPEALDYAINFFTRGAGRFLMDMKYGVTEALPLALSGNDEAIDWSKVPIVKRFMAGPAVERGANELYYDIRNRVIVAENKMKDPDYAEQASGLPETQLIGMVKSVETGMKNIRKALDAIEADPSYSAADRLEMTTQYKKQMRDMRLMVVQQYYDTLAATKKPMIDITVRGGATSP